MSRIGSARLIVALLLLTGCQQGPAGASDTLAQANDACAAGIPQACRQLEDTAHKTQSNPAQASAETHTEQVQRDVAAIIRGMRQTSASNGL